MNLNDAAYNFLENKTNIIPFNTTKDENGKWNKKPAVKEAKPFFTSLLLKSKVEESFKHANSIALVCGKISNNLVVIDIENSNYDGNKMISEFRLEFVKEIKEYKIPIIQSRSGGYHVYFKLAEKDDEHLLSTRVLAMFKHPTNQKEQILVETRGDESFCNTYPSEGYSEILHSVFDIPFLPSSLITAFYQFFSAYDCRVNRYENELSDDPSPQQLYNNDSVNTKQIKTLLENKGWRIANTRYKNEKEYYELIRPGKSKGISATFLYPSSDDKRRPGLFIFSNNYAPFPRSGFFSLYDCLAVLQFDGDHTKATTTLVKSGYGNISNHFMLDTVIKSLNQNGNPLETTIIELALQFKSESNAFLKDRATELYKTYKDEFNLKSKPKEIILEFVLKKAKLWVNKYGMTLMKGNEQVDVAYYWALMVRDYGYKGQLSTFNNYIKSGLPLQTKDPIDLFLKTSPVYDPQSEPSYISDFARKINCKEDYVNLERFGARCEFSGMKIDSIKSFHVTMLYKWMIRSIMQFFEGDKANRYAIIYQGGENAFKTTYCRYIGSFLPKIYTVEERFKNINADVMYKACRSFLTILEEFDGIKNMDDVKDIISKTNFNDRLPHHVSAISKVRITNYLGTTNKEDFLPYDQENTRFLVIPIKKINGDYDMNEDPGANNIDPRNLWREALYYYKEFVQNNSEGRKKYAALTKEEEAIQHAINSQFTDGGGAEFSIQKTIKVPDSKSTKVIFANLADIINFVRDNHHIAPMYKKEENLKKQLVRKTLADMGFELQKRSIYTNLQGKRKQGEYYRVQLINKGI